MVSPLHNFARLCECGRIASYRVQVQQFSGESRRQTANLYLCGVCYRLWLAVEGYDIAQAGRLDTRSVDGDSAPCYGNCRNGVPQTGGQVTELPTNYLGEKPLPKRVDDLLAELRAYLLANKFEFPAQVRIHVSEKRGVFKLELPPEVKRY